jgi:hypothetical protein
MNLPRLPDGRKIEPEVIERFWSKVDKTDGPDACWSWKRLVDKDGYGKFQISTGYRVQWHVRAHRFALYLSTGARPKNLALHSCDNPPCCNPKHLHEGTQKKNRVDCKARGRVARGETDGNAKMTTQNVIDLRRRLAEGESASSIAAEFGVTHTTILAAANRKTWAHVT